MLKDARLLTKGKYLLYLSEVPKHRFACKAVKISEDTSKRWRDEDMDFADECEARIAAWVRKTLKRTKPEFQLERILRDDFAQRSELTGKEGTELPAPIYNGLSDPETYDALYKFTKLKGTQNKRKW